MKIMDFLCPEAITIDLVAGDKKSTIVELAKMLHKTKKIKKMDEVYKCLENHLAKEKIHEVSNECDCGLESVFGGKNEQDRSVPL